jgi:hypothetical protein
VKEATRIRVFRGRGEASPGLVQIPNVGQKPRDVGSAIGVLRKQSPGTRKFRVVSSSIGKGNALPSRRIRALFHRISVPFESVLPPALVSTFQPNPASARRRTSASRSSALVAGDGFHQFLDQDLPMVQSRKPLPRSLRYPSALPTGTE